jgi:hypothetical protein
MVRNLYSLRIVLVVFRRVRLHQAFFINESGTPAMSLAFQLLWSSHDSWMQTMLCPIVLDSLLSVEKLNFIGLRANVEPFRVAGAHAPTDIDDEQFALLILWRTTFAHCHHLLAYSMLFKTPPYRFVGLLNPDPNKVKLAIADIKLFWDVVLKLEASTDFVWTTTGRHKHTPVVL